MTGSSLLTSDEAFRALASRALSAREVALDCEFHGERRYRPQLYLVQLNVDGEVAAVDPARVDLTVLREVLEHPGIRKIFHAGREDVRLLTRATGATDIAGVLDTQVAAGFLGYGPSIGYAKLVKELLGLDLDKSQQFTDWSSGLTEEQVDYALNDVRHLPRAAELLSEEASNRRGRLDWALEASRAATVGALSEPDRRRLYRKVHGFAKLGSTELGVLRELVVWREEVAETENCRPESVASDAGLKQLALRPPARHGQVRGTRGVAIGGSERHWSALRDAVARGAAEPEPLPELAEPDIRVDTIAVLLGAVRRVVAIEYDIAPELLGSTAELRDLSEWHLLGRATPAPALDVLSGWRLTLVGSRLLATLAGEVGLRVEPSSPSGLVLVATGG